MFNVPEFVSKDGKVILRIAFAIKRIGKLPEATAKLVAQTIPICLQPVSHAGAYL